MTEVVVPGRRPVVGRTLPRPGGETVPGKERRPHTRSAIIALYGSLCKSLWKSNRERQRGAGHTKRTACRGWPRCQLPAGAVRPPAHTLPGPRACLLMPCPARVACSHPARAMCPPARTGSVLGLLTCSHPARAACPPPHTLLGPHDHLLTPCPSGLLASSRPARATCLPARILPGWPAHLLTPCWGRAPASSHPARAMCPPARALLGPPAHLLAPCPGGLLASSRPTHLLAPVQSLACTPHFCQTARKGLGNAMPSQVLTSLPGTRAGGLPLSPPDPRAGGRAGCRLA